MLTVDLSCDLVTDFTFQEVSLYSHLVDILTFFVRQHYLRCRGFMHGESLTPRVAQLLTVPQKHLKLSKLFTLRFGRGRSSPGIWIGLDYPFTDFVFFPNQLH